MSQEVGPALVVHRVMNLHWCNIIFKPDGAHTTSCQDVLHVSVLEAALRLVLSIFVEGAFRVLVLGLRDVEDVFNVQLATPESLLVRGFAIELVIHCHTVARLYLLELLLLAKGKMVDRVFHSDLVVPVKQLLVGFPEIMRRNMEIAGDLMNVNRANHLTALLLLKRFHSLEVYLFLITSVVGLNRAVSVNYFALRVEHSLLHGADDVDNVHTCHINDVKRQNRAGRLWECHIQV